jgi:hypothetical protein
MKEFRSPVFALVLAILVVVLFGVGGCSDGDGSSDSTASANGVKAQDLAALIQRIETLERQIAEQEKTQSAERRLMVNALEASSERLDTVLGALLSGKIKPPKKPRATRNPELPPDKGKITKGDSPKTLSPKTVAPTDKVAKNSLPKKPIPSVEGTKPQIADPAVDKATSIFGDIDFAQGLVIFLAVSLLLLVLVVVYFPGRLRGVPKVEYNAIEEEVIVGLQVDPDAAAVAATVAASRATESVAPRPSALKSPSSPSEPDLSAPDLMAPDLSEPDVMAPDVGSPRGNIPQSRPEDRPVPHELAIRVADPDDIAGLAEVLDRFLTTDPYILNQPAPQVALDDGELHLRFFALPTLSDTEHALLDQAVRRLKPPESHHSEAS